MAGGLGWCLTVAGKQGLGSFSSWGPTEQEALHHLPVAATADAEPDTEELRPKGRGDHGLVAKRYSGLPGTYGQAGSDTDNQISREVSTDLWEQGAPHDTVPRYILTQALSTFPFRMKDASLGRKGARKARAASQARFSPKCDPNRDPQTMTNAANTSNPKAALEKQRNVLSSSWATLPLSPLYSFTNSFLISSSLWKTSRFTKLSLSSEF